MEDPWGLLFLLYNLFSGLAIEEIMELFFVGR